MRFKVDSLNMEMHMFSPQSKVHFVALVGFLLGYTSCVSTVTPSKDDVPRMDTIRYRVSESTDDRVVDIDFSLVERFDLDRFINDSILELNVTPDSLEYGLYERPFGGMAREIPVSVFFRAENNQLFTGLLCIEYSSGKAAVEIPVREGYVDGMVRLNYPNGVAMLRNEYRSGHPHGLHLEYFSNGVVSLLKQYSNGKAIAATSQFFENGYIWAQHRTNEKGVEFSRGFYFNGMTSETTTIPGWYRTWGSEGKLTYEALWVDGKMLMEKRLGQIGNSEGPYHHESE